MHATPGGRAEPLAQRSGELLARAVERRGEPDEPREIGLPRLFPLAELFGQHLQPDRKSTRLNSSHSSISYAVFCLKKKKKNYTQAFSLYSIPIHAWLLYRVARYKYVPMRL